MRLGLVRTSLLVVVPLVVVPLTLYVVFGRGSEGGDDPAAGSSIPEATSPRPAASTPAPDLAAATVSLDVAERVVSERPLPVRVRLTGGYAGSTDGIAIEVQARGSGASRWTSLGTAALDSRGTAELTTALWKSSELRARATSSGEGSRWAMHEVTVTPAGEPVIPPDGAPEPKPTGIQAPQAAGSGAAAEVARIPDNVWDSMQGISWRPGCLARSQLRLVSVNYWGFDGFRYRGRIVVRASLAGDVAEIFTDLYAQRYPIRMMVLPDVFGRSPNGIGANDYKQMAAGNASGFNCRYVVGQEEQRTMSLHASGRAVDFNTWENPYVSPQGNYPDEWYLQHRPRSARPVLHAGDPAVRAFTSRGWTWGGTWSEKDWQHFQK